MPRRRRLRDLTWRIPRERLPRVAFGDPDSAPREPNPVTTYYLVVVPALILTLFGLVMGFSAQAVTNIADGEDPYLAYLKPLGVIVVAVLLAALTQMVPARVFYRVAVPVFVGALILQSLVVTPLGLSAGGNSNWVKLPGLPAFQPSEFLKLALVVVLARLVDRRGTRIGDWRQMGVVVGLPVVVSLVDVMLGHDLGTMMVVFSAAVGCLWVGGLKGAWFRNIGLLVVPVLGFIVASNPTRIKRVLAVLPGMRPPRDLSAPEQIDHSWWAFGAGGLTGLGPGASREKWNYLQAAHTDFILAIIGEEFGLLGTLSVLLCIGLLVWGAVRVCREAQTLFSAMIAGGVASWIGAQAVINIMSVTGIGPVIGVPLPLVSYGGSSFLFTAVAVGVVASLARGRAGMKMWGGPDEAWAGRDPRVAPRRRKAR
ncbi:putative lipid II flippase FtsW [Actinomyces sp. B33]|uniref:FtsW/RodA/SpoVE family cell cycle protein n=1 Tax=Actinomyces sp. B33 TaxID=2942131 RepID=UPI0023404B98|nr:putative peptidoglycan glycosyltransferase FtsW [Actinomyces sp. B33]MDC4233081.1 putative lipid II flippase FtsW [Actinomyces sp. B33]